MKSLPPILLFLLFGCAVLLTACTSPGYNDNPSQIPIKAKAGCRFANDFYAAYFSVYIKPAGDVKSKEFDDRYALYRPYCTDIPTVGTAFFTAELTGSDIRQIPIGIRVVEQEYTGGGESDAENFKDIRVVSDVPAKLYPRGVVEIDAELDKNGYYAFYLMIEGEDRLRIPLRVGVDPDAAPVVSRIAVSIGGALGFALLGFVVYRYTRRHNPSWR